MELAASLSPYFCPLGAFLEPSDSTLMREAKRYSQPSTDFDKSAELWENSSLNPCKRVNSLQKPSYTRWRIDGSADRGTRFFAVPVYMSPGLVPMRVDVSIPDQSKVPPPLRQTLQCAEAFYMRGAEVSQLGIAEFICRVLEYWEATAEGFRAAYEAMPFGSRIILENITFKIEEVKARFIPNLQKEMQLLSIDVLQAFWKLPLSVWPASVDITELELCFQLHDTISLVQIPHLYASKTFAFKSAIHDAKYLYHELKLLLTIPPHLNIISKPKHLVVGKAQLSEQVKLYGFILEYHAGGNLSNVLDTRAASNTLKLADQLRWARQITSTLSFIHDSPARFYSELKPSNLILSKPDESIKFIDFEQFGNWETFSAPEIHYVENVVKLATSAAVPGLKRDFYQSMLREHIRETSTCEAIYTNPSKGYYEAWNSLTSFQREAATVFSLGKMLWCIFEGCSHTKNSMDEDYEHESDVEFPEFRRTPRWMRKIIRDCTRGALDWSNARIEIVRRGSRFYSRCSPALGESSVEAAFRALGAAKAMWLKKVQHMEEYLEAKSRWQRGLASNEDEVLLGFSLRPSLEDVFAAIIEEDNLLKP